MGLDVEDANDVQGQPWRSGTPVRDLIPPGDAPMDVPMGATAYLPQYLRTSPHGVAAKKMFRVPEKTLLPAPHRTGETPPRADGPTVPPTGAYPDDADLVAAPAYIQADVQETGAAGNVENVYVNKRLGDVYERKPDGSYLHIGHIDRAAFVANARTAEDPDQMKPMTQEQDMYGELPENAKDPRVDSAGNVWDLGNPSGPIYLGHTDRDIFIPAAKYTGDPANPTGAGPLVPVPPKGSAPQDHDLIALTPAQCARMPMSAIVGFPCINAQSRDVYARLLDGTYIRIGHFDRDGMFFSQEAPESPQGMVPVLHAEETSTQAMSRNAMWTRFAAHPEQTYVDRNNDIWDFNDPKYPVYLGFVDHSHIVPAPRSAVLPPK